MAATERELEKQLKALANRRRLAILKYLKSKREAPVGDIAHEINLSFKSTSKHLAVLAALDIVERDQRSLQMFYHLTSTHPAAVRHILSLL
jgi:DNA-binding transcriptional ArsR family regulator